MYWGDGAGALVMRDKNIINSHVYMFHPYTKNKEPLRFLSERLT